jgi:polar amino acid transport system permease protein
MVMATHLNGNHIAYLLQGTVWTIALSLIACGGGGLLGLVVALCRVAPGALLRNVSGLYVHIVQGTPPLVAMFLLYFGLPGLGINVPSLLAAGFALVINVSAFLGEIWRGCIESVPRPQWEAAECLALSRTQRMVKVVLPQAVRIAIPPTVGFSVQVIKNTSLASVVGLLELVRSGQIINNSLFEPFLIYLAIAGIYFCLCFPISRLSRRLEQRASRGRRVLAEPGAVAAAPVAP